MKVLHLTFHQGCLKAFENVSQLFNFDLESWFIPNIKNFDPLTSGNSLYNMTRLKAERIWNNHVLTFQKFDLVITSDTVPLSRIFLEAIKKGLWNKPLIIWICNRFDYYDGASLDPSDPFPDKDYYDLFKNIPSNVKIVAYTEYEHYYARKKGINTGNITITPFSTIQKIEFTTNDHKDTFFLPPYHNETIFKVNGKSVSEFLFDLGIPNYCGRYNNPLELEEFKGIIHLPYAWSNLALFENISLGLIYFIPSLTFLLELLKYDDYFHMEPQELRENKLFHLSEWYKPERKEIFIYFDSWQDLKYKTSTILEPGDQGTISKREKIKEYAINHRNEMINKWVELFFASEK